MPKECSLQSQQQPVCVIRCLRYQLHLPQTHDWQGVTLALLVQQHHAWLLVSSAEPSSRNAWEVEERLCSAPIISTLLAHHINHAMLLVNGTIPPC